MPFEPATPANSGSPHPTSRHRRVGGQLGGPTRRQHKSCSPRCWATNNEPEGAQAGFASPHRESFVQLGSSAYSAGREARSNLHGRVRPQPSGALLAAVGSQARGGRQPATEVWSTRRWSSAATQDCCAWWEKGTQPVLPRMCVLDRLAVTPKRSARTGDSGRRLLFEGFSPSRQHTVFVLAAITSGEARLRATPHAEEAAPRCNPHLSTPETSKANRSRTQPGLLATSLRLPALRHAPLEERGLWRRGRL